MCDPATALLAAATATQAVGKGVSAIQSAAASRYQARVADRNAALEAEAGRNAQERTRFEARRLYQKGAQVAGQQRAAMAANGIDLGFGSAVQVQEDTRAMIDQDVAQLYRAGAEEARSYDIRGSNARAQARSARQAASAALIQGGFDVAGSILGGAKEYSKYKGRG